jgi:hypothetical protein
VTPTRSIWSKSQPLANRHDAAPALPGLGTACDQLGARLIESARLATAMHLFEVAQACGGRDWRGENDRLTSDGRTEAAPIQGHADARMPGE